jgi:2-keto-4-pentenoate hydratase/2-oxohepta-3-ene-1,7-dioic acid hydratase in catechol pathway
MKLCRFVPLDSNFSTTEAEGGTAVQGGVRSGIVEGDSIAEIRGEIWGDRQRTGKSWALSSVKMLAPAAPSKIVCEGRNFAGHASELGNALPKEPLIFLKPPSSVIAPGEPIVLPRISQRVDYEGELAVVMGRRLTSALAGAGKSLPEDFKSYIAGYTCLNDVTMRDLQKTDAQWWRSKGADTFCPFGPVVETELNPAASVETFVNGFRKQSAPISDLIFSVNVIIRWIAQVMTLEPGDVIAMGTPEGVGPLAAGDTVEVTVTGIGTLRNPVVASHE